MSTKYAIVGGKLIDGTGAEPVENSLVLVDDNGKIEYAGVMQDLPEGVEVIDAAGKTVLPVFPFKCPCAALLRCCAAFQQTFHSGSFRLVTVFC